MKWYQHIFTKDTQGGGTGEKRRTVKDLTDEELSAKNKRMRLEKDYSKLSKETREKSRFETASDAVKNISEHVNQSKNANDRKLEKLRSQKEKLDLSSMTDADLRQAISRAQLERQYNDYFAKSPEVSRGRAFVTKALDIGSAALPAVGSALSIAIAVQQLRKI